MNLSEKSYASVLFFLLGYMASREASLRAFLHRDCDKTSFMDFFLVIKILSFQNSTMRTEGADGETAHALAFPLQFVAGSRITESFLLLPFLFLHFWSLIMKRAVLGLSLKAIIFYRQRGGAEPGGGTPAM